MPFSSAAFALPQRLGDLLVVTGEDGIRLVGDATRDKGRRRSEERIADLDVVVEEGQRPAALHRLQPERDLSELRSHRLDVDAVHAAHDDIPHGGVEVRGCEVLALSPDRRQPLGDASRRGDEEVPRPTCGIADRHREEGRFGIGGLHRLV